MTALVFMRYSLPRMQLIIYSLPLFPPLSQEREKRDAKEVLAKRTIGKARVVAERAQAETFRLEKEERSYGRLFAGASSDDRAKAEKDRMAKVAAAATGGGGGGGKGKGKGREMPTEVEEEVDESLVAARKVRAVEDDFM